MKKTIIIFIVIIFLFILYLFLTLALLGSRNKGGAGTIQASWVNGFREDMENYYNTHHTFPPLGESCSNILILEKYTTKPDSFQFYKQKLVREKSVGEIFLRNLLQRGLLPSSERHSLDDFNDYNISVSVSPDGNRFVLQSSGDFEPRFLEKDADGKILGCDCNDPYYCLEA